MPTTAQRPPRHRPRRQPATHDDDPPAQLDHLEPVGAADAIDLAAVTAPAAEKRIPATFIALVFLIVTSNGNTARTAVLLAVSLSAGVAAVVLAGPTATIAAVAIAGGLSSLLGTAGLLARRRNRRTT